MSDEQRAAVDDFVIATERSDDFVIPSAAEGSVKTASEGFHIFAFYILIFYFTPARIVGWASAHADKITIRRIPHFAFTLYPLRVLRLPSNAFIEGGYNTIREKVCIVISGTMTMKKKRS